MMVQDPLHDFVQPPLVQTTLERGENTAAARSGCYLSLSRLARGHFQTRTGSAQPLCSMTSFNSAGTLDVWSLLEGKGGVGGDGVDRAVDRRWHWAWQGSAREGMGVVVVLNLIYTPAGKESLSEINCKAA